MAVQRGPIVYCLESPDMPKGIRVQDVVVPADVSLVPRYDAELLDGVTVIEAKVLARLAGDWKDKLYRPLSDEHESPIRVRFIPYYAWSNRGESEMSVWLPVQSAKSLLPVPPESRQPGPDNTRRKGTAP